MSDNLGFQNSSTPPPPPMSGNALQTNQGFSESSSGTQSPSQSNENKTQPAQTPQPSGVSTQPNVIEDQNNLAQSMITSNPRKKGGFVVFIVVGVMIIIGAWAFAGFQYLRNKKEKVEVDLLQQESTSSPTRVFSAERIEIKGGNVVNQMQSGEVKILVEKTDYPETGITGFARVSVSPDEKYICFESISPAPEPALYLAYIDGSDAVMISENKTGCLWTDDSKLLIYKNQVSLGKGSDIFAYDILNQEEKNLTAEYHQGTGTSSFATVGLSADSSKIICTYSSGDEENQVIRNCEIDLGTFEVVVEDENERV